MSQRSSSEPYQTHLPACGGLGMVGRRALWSWPGLRSIFRRCLESARSARELQSSLSFVITVWSPVPSRISSPGKAVLGAVTLRGPDGFVYSRLNHFRVDNNVEALSAFVPGVECFEASSRRGVDKSSDVIDV